MRVVPGKRVRLALASWETEGLTMPPSAEGHDEQIGERRRHGLDAVMQRKVRHIRVAHRMAAAAQRDGEQREQVAALETPGAEALGERLRS